MPVPATTGRTFWFNASDNDKLWDAIPAGSGSNPTDGGNVKSWDDEDAGNEEFQEATSFPVWRSSGINGLGAVDGVSNKMDGTGSGSTLSNVITVSAHTAFVSFYMEAAATDEANISQNPVLVQDTFTRFGIYAKTVTGVHSVYGLGYDGAYKDVAKTFSLNTPYVVMTRHDAGNLYISLNQGSESSVALGDADILSGVLRIFYSGVQAFNGRLGELLIYNTVLTGSDFTDTYQYMMDKWVVAGIPNLTIQIPPPSVAGITAQLV